jgi:hypothetical protein
VPSTSWDAFAQSRATLWLFMNKMEKQRSLNGLNNKFAVNLDLSDLDDVYVAPSEWDSDAKLESRRLSGKREYGCGVSPVVSDLVPHPREKMGVIKLVASTSSGVGDLASSNRMALLLSLGSKATDMG